MWKDKRNEDRNREHIAKDGRSSFINKVQRQQTSLQKKKKKSTEESNQTESQPIIYFAPWSLFPFSFSTAYMDCPSARGYDPEVATSTKEGILSRAGVFFAVPEDVMAPSLNLEGWSSTQVG